MGRESDHIECPYRQVEAGQARCRIPDCIMQEHPCPSCVELPLVDALLNPETKHRQAQYLENIRRALAQDRATLVLGAGISKPMGMPDWLGLISQMSGYALQYSDYTAGSIPTTDRRIAVKLEEELIFGVLQLFKGVNVLESAQYIEETLRRAARGKPVQSLIKEILSTIIEQSMTLDTWVEKRWKKDYPEVTLTPLAAAQRYSLCTVAHLLCTENGFRRTLTYNFDTLLQEYLIDLFNVRPNQIFTHPGKWSTYQMPDNKDSIQIFHVHGCIPRQKNQANPSSAFPMESDQIILTENSYYNTEQSGSYNWQNSIQSYYLNRDSCVFVGFSADDYNFRRILKQRGEVDSPPHYLLLTVNDTARETWATICRRSLFSGASADQIREQTLKLLQMQLYMKTLYWERRGFHPIWVTINDIPSYLLSLL